jgi:hypothetical protein
MTHRHFGQPVLCDATSPVSQRYPRPSPQTFFYYFALIKFILCKVNQLFVQFSQCTVTNICRNNLLLWSTENYDGVWALLGLSPLGIRGMALLEKYPKHFWTIFLASQGERKAVFFKGKNSTQEIFAPIFDLIIFRSELAKKIEGIFRNIFWPIHSIYGAVTPGRGWRQRKMCCRPARKQNLPAQ